jgi:hypothetical protein
MARLTAAQATELAKAEDRCTAAREEKSAADEARKTLRDKYRSRLSLGKAVRAGGVEVLVKKVAKGASFRIAAYEAGHKITKAMAPFYTPAGTKEEWQVTRLPEGTDT